MKIGEQDVPTLEQWLALEAASARDASITSATSQANYAANVNGHGKFGNGRAELDLQSAERRDSEACGGAGSGGGFRLGVDPWLLSAGTARSLTAKLAESGGALVPISGWVSSLPRKNFGSYKPVSGF